MKVYHFHNGTGGGVWSVIKNLLRFSDSGIENHIIHAINRAIVPQYSIEPVEGAPSQQVYYYSANNNFYYTCRQLAKLLPDDKAIIIAHDWVELGMVSNLGLQNPVVQVVHGNYDYYYELASRHEKSIEKFITVSPVIYKKLCSILPDRKADIQYCRFPVPIIQADGKENGLLKIFFCVRNLLDENKQFRLLPLVNAKLKAKGIAVHWTIIGDGIKIDKLKNLMAQEEGIILISNISNEDVIRILPGHDLFILPSLKEGFPVAMVEAMKAGLVPLVTNWDGATNELIIPGETGYYYNQGDVDGYADTIALLNMDRKLLKHLAGIAIKLANELFDPWVNAKIVEHVFGKAIASRVNQKAAYKAYGSRLDQPFIPNSVTSFFRRWRF